MLTGCTNDIMTDIQGSFGSAVDKFQKDAKSITTIQAPPSDSDIKTLQSAVDHIKAKKNNELAPINSKISEKEAQIIKILMDKNLTASQKKAKTSLIQADINTLKLQKEKIEEHYRQEIKDFRY